MNTWSKRSRKFLAASGFLIALAPVLGAFFLIDQHTRQQAASQVTEVTGEFLARAESAIDGGLTTLTDLAILGVEGCSEDELDILRRSVYANYWVKEVGITDANGQIRCNHIGDEIDVTMLSAPHGGLNKNVSLQLVELGSPDHPGIMLLWQLADDVGLSVTIPSDAVTMAPTPKFIKETAAGSLTLADGTLIGGLSSIGSVQKPPEGVELVTASATSARYPVTVKLAVPLETFMQRNRSLLIYGVAGGALVGLLIIGLSLYALRGPPERIARLREAADRDEFIAYYQPVVDIRTCRLVGCEALMRWRKSDGTIVAPGEFIQTAESSGLAGIMTLSLMRHIREDLGEVYGDRPSLKVGINLFEGHFSERRTVSDVARIFESGPIAFEQLVFELTERQPLKNIETAREIIAGLQSLGARVALDDAGTGHAGLAYLQQLGVDAVKIDKLFVDRIAPGADSAPIVDSLIKLGHDLDMEVVAEGVETVVQLDYLAERGADSAQGFLFAPPLPARAFVDLVKAVSPDKRHGARASRAPRMVA